MKPQPDSDPLLEAILGEDRDHPGADLDILLAGARRRRHGRRTRQGFVVAGLSLALLGGVLVGWEKGRSPALATPISYTLVRTEVGLRPQEIHTATTSVDQVDSVSTLADAAVEVVSTDEATLGTLLPADDQTFLASLPGPAGFIGEGASRRLILLTQNPPEPLIIP